MQHWVTIWWVIAYTKDFRAKGQDCWLSNSKQLILNYAAWQPADTQLNTKRKNKKKKKGETRSCTHVQARRSTFFPEGVHHISVQLRTPKKCRKTNASQRALRAVSGNCSWPNNSQSSTSNAVLLTCKIPCSLVCWWELWNWTLNRMLELIQSGSFRISTANILEINNLATQISIRETRHINLKCMKCLALFLYVICNVC